VEWHWVYGHNNHKENEKVDALAKEAIGGRKNDD
jgi:ribonuclease HI